jgi:hypothetical protein
LCLNKTKIGKQINLKFGSNKTKLPKQNSQNHLKSPALLWFYQHFFRNWYNPNVRVRDWVISRSFTTWYLYLCRSFFAMKHTWINSFNLPFNFEWGIVDSTNIFFETDTIQMFEFVIDNIFAMLSGHVFQQTISIPMGTNCTTLFAYLFLHS